MTYAYGSTLTKPKAVAVTTDEVRVRLERLRAMQAQLDAELDAKEKELARIRAARKKLQPVATYAPTPEQLAYREQYGHIIAAQPEPMWGGPKGLKLAADEMERCWSYK